MSRFYELFIQCVIFIILELAIPELIGEQDEAPKPGIEPKVAYDIYLVRKTPFSQNELRRSENFRSGCEILRLGALMPKVPTSYLARAYWGGR